MDISQGHPKFATGVTDPWDQYFNWMNGWQKVLAQVGVTVLILLILLVCASLHEDV